MSNLPAGTVTFLFTDVEGSTRMWDVFPDDMRVALALHDDAVTSAVAAHGGCVVKHTGDGLFLAFASAQQAFACAVDAQRRLSAADWPDVIGPLGVRMALHTADAEPVDGDYHSPEVNRVARIEAAGHGGQVLLSDAARAFITDLPQGVSVRDLGEHALRGISRPERIHEASIEELRTVFPPLRTASAIPGHLPAFSTSFVGRGRELADLVDIVTEPESRIVTLLGPGGIGKSRLGVEVARAAAPRIGAVAHFLSLEAITDPGHIVKALADSIDFTLDLHVSAAVSERTQVFDRLRTQPLVLVLDNLEHLPGAGPLLADMVAELADLTIIATSRERIGVSAEQVVTVEGLDWEQDALALLVQRARQAGGEVDESAPEAAHLVALVGGMPLAIEMAAAWTPLLDLAEINTEIGRDLDFLSSSAADVPDRHRSVRAVFDQSWRRLEPGAREALAAISIFVAPFSREAALEVAGASLPILATLVNGSLLRRHPLAGTYSLHPLLREFATDHLTSRRPVEERYARYFLAGLAAQRERLAGRDQIAARDELVEELDHLRFAVGWGMGHLPDDEMYDLVAAFGELLFIHSWADQAVDLHRLAVLGEEAFGQVGARDRKSYLLARAMEAITQANFLPPDDVEAILAPVLASTTDADGLARATALTARGVVEEYRNDSAAAIEWYERAAAIEMPHNPLCSSVLGSWYGWAHLQIGNAQEARRIFQAALARAESDGFEIGRAYLLSKLGTAADGIGEHRQAVEYHHEGREIFVKAGDIGGQGYTLSRLSWSHNSMGNWDLARRYGLEGLEKFEEMNHRWGIAVSNGRVGLAEIELGLLDSAAHRFLETLRIAEESGLPDQLHYGVIGVGRLLHAVGDDRAAARLLAGSAAAERNPYRDIADRVLPQLEAALGDDFADVVAEASEVDLEGLVREARNHARHHAGES